MTKEELRKIFEKEETTCIAWQGKCHDCGCDIEVVTSLEADGALIVTGGAIYGNKDGVHHMKCETCFEKDSKLHNFRECEVFVRCVGYLRPVRDMNPGKQAEVANRKKFNTGEYLS